MSSATGGEVPHESPDESPESDQPARPASKPIPKKQVSVRDPREETGDEPGSLYRDTDVGGPTLARLISLRPFMTYFCWLAHKQNPAGHRPETRVHSLRTQSPYFYWVCVTLDIIVIVIALVLLIAAAGAALYKTIWL